MSATPTPLDLARRFIARDTCNPPGHEDVFSDLLASLLEPAGFALSRFEHAPGRVSLVARLAGGGEAPPLMFCGHGDTVPLGAAPWHRPPLEPRVEGDRLYGRGSSDMKSGLAALTWAGLTLAALPRPRAGLTLVYCADEENGCRGSRFLAQDPARVGPAGALVVAEPTANQPWLGHKGVLWLRASFQGKAAHASMPQAGENAIYKAARAVTAFAELDLSAWDHPYLGGPTRNVGTINGGTRINMVPDAAELTLDLRTLPEMDHAALLGMVQAAAPEAAAWEVLDDTQSLWTDPGHPWVRESWDLVHAITGQEPRPGGAPYFTDAAHLAPALGHPPCLILGPGEPSQAHQTDEWCELKRLDQAARIYLEMARRWCGA